jgi:mono/diheme cytochrome c family protein
MNRFRLAALVLVAIGISTAALAVEKSTKAAAPAAKTKAPAEAKPTAAVLDRGKKLAMFGGCIDCHTPGALYGAPDITRQLSGSEMGWSGPWGTSYARNLTPDLETGLGYYKEHEIILALKSGKRLDGKPMLPPMPWQSIATLSDADMHALVAYLQSLPPVAHQVPDALPPGQAPTGPALTIPAPSAWDAPKTTAAPGK